MTVYFHFYSFFKVFQWLFFYTNLRIFFKHIRYVESELLLDGIILMKCKKTSFKLLTKNI